MSFFTELMRDGADKIISAFKGEDGLWHGVEMVNHPTPSGCDRWLPTYSDKRGWPSEEIAKAELSMSLPSPSARVEGGRP